MHRLPIPLFLLLICSCTQQKESENVDLNNVRAEVEAMLDAYHSAIAESGLTAEFDYLDDSPEFFWVPPGFTSALDYHEVREILEQNAGMFRSVDFEWEALEVFPLSENIATYTGTVRGRMVDTSGTETLSRILESGTLIKRESGWKLLSGQSRESEEVREGVSFKRVGSLGGCYFGA